MDVLGVMYVLNVIGVIAGFAVLGGSDVLAAFGVHHRRRWGPYGGPVGRFGLAGGGSQWKPVHTPSGGEADESPCPRVVSGKRVRTRGGEADESPCPRVVSGKRLRNRGRKAQNAKVLAEQGRPAAGEKAPSGDPNAFAEHGRPFPGFRSVGQLFDRSGGSAGRPPKRARARAAAWSRQADGSPWPLLD